MAKSGFLDRTLAQLRGAWKDIAGRGKFTPRPDLPDDVAHHLQCRRQIVAHDGEREIRLARRSDVLHDHVDRDIPLGDGREDR